MNPVAVKKIISNPAVIVALSALFLSAAFFLFWPRSESYASRLECQQKGECECGQVSGDVRENPAWECVRPLPEACMFSPGSDRKAINSVQFARRQAEAERILKFDLCQGKVLENGQADRESDAGFARELVKRLNESDFLHLQDRLFPDPDYQGVENYLTVEYHSEAGAAALETFRRTASCGDACGSGLKSILELLEAEITH